MPIRSNRPSTEQVNADLLSDIKRRRQWQAVRFLHYAIKDLDLVSDKNLASRIKAKIQIAMDELNTNIKENNHESQPVTITVQS
jgi:hypothetical protein